MTATPLIYIFLFFLASAAEAKGLSQSDGDFKKHGAKVSKLKYTAACALKELSEGLETGAVNVD